MGEFRARFDVSHINDITTGLWELGGNIVDTTGSFTAMDVSVGDLIIARGWDSLGDVVFDRLQITEIIGRDLNYLLVQVINDKAGDLLTAAGRPMGGSLPIGSHLWFNTFINKASSYQAQFDPDYDAGIDMLNLQELQHKFERFYLIDNISSGIILATPNHPGLPNPQFYKLIGDTYKASQLEYTINLAGDISWTSINPITGYLVIS